MGHPEYSEYLIAHMGCPKYSEYLTAHDRRLDKGPANMIFRPPGDQVLSLHHLNRSPKKHPLAVALIRCEPSGTLLRKGFAERFSASRKNHFRPRMTPQRQQGVTSTSSQ